MYQQSYSESNLTKTELLYNKECEIISVSRDNPQKSRSCKCSKICFAFVLVYQKKQPKTIKYNSVCGCLWRNSEKRQRNDHNARIPHDGTHSYFTQVDPIIQRVPGTLLVVGPPWFLKDLTDAFPLLTFESVTARDTWRARNAVGSRVAVSSRGACWTLHAAAILEKQNRVQSGNTK